MSEKTIFHVEDMSCGHCEKTIRQALSEALPDAAVDVDLAGQTVSIAGDAAMARAAIAGAGYTPVAARH